MLSRVGGASRVVRVASVRFASQDKSLEYVGKDFLPKFDDEEALKKRFLRGLPEEFVQDPAFQKVSFAALRQHTATHTKGEHPVVTEAIKEANQLDTEVENKLTSLSEEEALPQIVGHFPYGNIRKGDEDSALYNEIDWDFFSTVLDEEFVTSMKKTYEECIEDAFRTCQDVDHVPVELGYVERFEKQMEEMMDARLEPLYEAAPDMEYDFRNMSEAVDDIIRDWDQVKVWTAAPRVAAYIQNNIDNNNWDMSDESKWMQLDKAVR